MVIQNKKKPSLQKIKKALKKERDRIKALLLRRGRADSKIQGNYVTNFPNVGDEEGDSVFEAVTYEENLAIEHVLEKRLKQIESDLKKIEAGTYRI